MPLRARSRQAIIAASLLALVSLTACGSLGTQQATAVDAATNISQQSELSTFAKLVKQAGLEAELSGAGPATVFAPTDDAFKALPAATLDKLSKDTEALKNVLRYHVVAASIQSKAVTGTQSYDTLQGGKLSLSKAGDFLTVDEAMVVKADTITSNGVIHTIDSVLTPPKKK